MPRGKVKKLGSAWSKRKHHVHVVTDHQTLLSMLESFAGLISSILAGWYGRIVRVIVIRLPTSAVETTSICEQKLSGRVGGQKYIHGKSTANCNWIMVQVGWPTSRRHPVC